MEKWEELRKSDPEEYKRLVAKRDQLHKNMEMGPVYKKIADVLSASLIIACVVLYLEYYHVWEDLGVKQAVQDLTKDL